MGSSRSRARTRVPCIGRRILNHCATREVPDYTFVTSLICIYAEQFLALTLLPCLSQRGGMACALQSWQVFCWLLPRVPSRALHSCHLCSHTSDFWISVFGLDLWPELHLWIQSPTPPQSSPRCSSPFRLSISKLFKLSWIYYILRANPCLLLHFLCWWIYHHPLGYLSRKLGRS